MGDKKRRTVSVDEEVDEFLSDHVNASALINALVREYRIVGSSREAAKQKQIDEKENRIRDLKQDRAEKDSQIEQIEREIKQLREEYQTLSSDEERAVREVVGFCTPDEDGKVSLDPSVLSADHEVIRRHSTKAGMDPDQFLAEVRDRL